MDHPLPVLRPFLDDLPLRRSRTEATDGIAPRGLLLGQGNPALEVLVFDLHAAPSPTWLRRAWKERQRDRAAPLLAVVLHGDAATVCGPTGPSPRLFVMQAAQAERLGRRALAEPDRNFALRYLQDALPASQTDTALPGFRNEGLLTDHILREHAGEAGFDLPTATARGLAALTAEDDGLLRALGFGVEKLGDGVTNVLRVGAQKRAVAVVLRADELEENAAERFQRASPIAWALDRADRENLPWVVMVQRDRVRLYPRDIGVGVGRRGRTDTWMQVRTDLVRQDQAALLWLVFSADALAAGGTIERLLDASKRFAKGLAERLRERVYDEVVPRLAAGIAAARGVAAPDVAELRLTYAMAVTLLFRLLFLAYAEDRDLLPYATNDAYQRRSLKAKARELHAQDTSLGAGARHWQEVALLCEAVRRGDAALGVPAYGGGLFETDAAVSPAGAALAGIALPDAVFEPALRALLLDLGGDLGAPSAGPVDFRVLRVREFGTIYEGLLESELAVAPVGLVLKREKNRDVYAPAKPGETARVAAGAIYLHNRSGARKSSGSYFTPGFAVDHLIEAALGPALAAHAARLAALDETDAAAAFFDLRVADIAMGSGHFLVAAMDRIEQAFTAILVARDLPGVRGELGLLRETALGALGEASAAPIEDAQLLRRQIALRCLYGVDLNPLAVDLARLSLWVHSFVPGLPLALLDDHLVHGNALVGVATVRQLKARFAASGMALFPVDAESLLGEAAAPLQRRARLADLTPHDVDEARRAVQEAQAVLEPTRALCDLMVADGIDAKTVAFQFENWPRERATIAAHPALKRARKVLDGLDALHFPVAFPEVFLRARPGFDAVLGNPPWEKVRTERDEFWSRHFPGLRGEKSAATREATMRRLARERPDLIALEAKERAAGEALRDAVRALPGMNTGHPDLFRAFASRFAALMTSEAGQFGVVLPGEAFKVKGNAPIRLALAEQASRVDVQMLTNRGGWVFAEVHPQKPIALVAASARGTESGECAYVLRPEFHGFDAFGARRLDNAVERPASWLRAYSAGLVQPTLPSGPAATSVAVIEAMMRSPRLGSHPAMRIRRVYADLETTRDNELYGARPGKGTVPVYGGDSFDLWQPDTTSYYALARRQEAFERVQQKRLNSPAGAPYGEMPRRWRDDPRTHPCRQPRIAYRDVTNRTNTRTLLAALIPAEVVTVQSAPWVLWLDPERPVAQEAFLVGVMSSIPADWWMRRFVETHVEEAAFNALPVPECDTASGLGARAVALAGRLAAPDGRFAAWAAAVGVAHGPLDPVDKQRMIEELDAVVASLYRLDAPMLAHIFDTFHDWPTPAQSQAWAARRDRTLAILATLS